MAYHSVNSDGTGGYLSCPIPAVSGHFWALSLWFKFLNTSGSFIAVMDDSASGANYRMLYDFTGVFAGFGGNMVPTAGNLGNDDNWHSLIITRSDTPVANTLDFYIDGTNVQSTFNNNTAGALTLHLGDNPSGGGSNCKGKYADVRLYNASLLGTDITNLVAGVDVTANLVRHWALTEGSGTTAADTSGNSVTATLTGAGITWDADVPSVLSGGGDTTPPVVASANVNAAGTTLTISFTEAGSPPVLPASSVTGFTLHASGGAVSLSSTAISSTTFTATTSRTILSGETLTLDYAPGNVTDSAGSPNAMGSFSGTSVTNNSTQTGPLTAGVASLTSSGPATIIVTATDATGGTPSYTYQWQRNTNGGSYSNISNGGGVSGATTRTLTDGSATGTNLYGYKLVYTDSAGSPATVTSNAITARLYSGGAFGGGLLTGSGMTGGVHRS